jgi:hypothetical protein
MVSLPSGKLREALTTFPKHIIIVSLVKFCLSLHISNDYETRLYLATVGIFPMH